MTVTFHQSAGGRFCSETKTRFFFFFCALLPRELVIFLSLGKKKNTKEEIALSRHHEIQLEVELSLSKKGKNYKNFEWRSCFIHYFQLFHLSPCRISRTLKSP